MSNESSVKNLLNGVEFDDPRMYTLLDQLIQDFYNLQNQVNPPVSNRVFGTTGVIIGPDTVDAFTAFLYVNNLKLAWLQIPGVVTYEIRYLFGTFDATAWDDANIILQTSTSSADINPLTVPLIYGDHTFLIKAQDSSGNFTPNASVVVVNIPQIPSPVITPTLITNFVLLNWSVPASVFLIDHYNIYKNGILVGTATGTFQSFFEAIGGEYTYVVEPVDIVGNVGTPSAGNTLSVSNPVDFTLHDILSSTFTGVKINTLAFDY